MTATLYATRHDRGTTLVEYGILVALLGTAAVALAAGGLWFMRAAYAYGACEVGGNVPLSECPAYPGEHSPAEVAPEPTPEPTPESTPTTTPTMVGVV